MSLYRFTIWLNRCSQCIATNGRPSLSVNRNPVYPSTILSYFGISRSSMITWKHRNTSYNMDNFLVPTLVFVDSITNRISEVIAYYHRSSLKDIYTDPSTVLSLRPLMLKLRSFTKVYSHYFTKRGIPISFSVFVRLFSRLSFRCFSLKILIVPFCVFGNRLNFSYYWI